MNIIRIVEIVLIILILRAVFPAIVRLVRGKRRGPAGERFSEERFDEKKADIEDGEYKDLK